MPQSKATTVDAYLAEMPADKRDAVNTVRALIRKRLPKGYVEGMQYGMIYYHIPLSRYPETYNGHPLCYVGLAAQKNYCAVYLMNVYADTPSEKRLREAFARAGKKFDMGKSCVRFKTADDLPLDAIGDVIASTSPEQFIEMYERGRPPARIK